MKHSIQIPFLVLLAFVLNACGTSASVQGDGTAQAIADAKRDVAVASQAIAQEGNSSTTARSPFFQPSMAGMMPGAGYGSAGSPFMVPKNMVYISGSTKGDIAWGVAAMDDSLDTCGGQCIRLYIEQLTRGQWVNSMNALSVEVDGNMLPIYYGGTIGQPIGEFVLSDGTKVTRTIYVAPVMNDFKTGIRVRLEDPGAHNVKVTFYKRGRFQYFATQQRHLTVNNQRFEWSIREGSATTL